MRRLHTSLLHITIVVTLAFALTSAPALSADGEHLLICSFNVQWVGYPEERDVKALAEVVKQADIVLVQEVVSPPYPGKFPDGTDYRPDPESRAFFDAMRKVGFSYHLSEEDTGPVRSNHVNNAWTEWFVAFYRDNCVSLADDLPRGFLAEDLTANGVYDRVPYAFGFRHNGDTLDFVLISVHLTKGRYEAARRKNELGKIHKWALAQPTIERDYIIAGDMNIEDKDELHDVRPRGFHSLNYRCDPTNTNPEGPKPYDHVMYRPYYTSKEIDRSFGFSVTNLVAEMKSFWNSALGFYPGKPYVHKVFRKYYSDHDPVFFQMRIPQRDDD